METAFTAVAVGLCFAWPRMALGRFAQFERQLNRLARRRMLSVLVVGLATLALRFSILPLLPVPVPFTADDYSNLLAADTFAHGRLASPTPAMWVHFESMHVDMKPAYASMYFPGEGLLLAAGKLLLGHFWLAVPFAAALMCSGICWMLQGWLPPSWALLGGFLAMLRLGVFSYWTNTYHTAGTLAALGGALVLGALPRFQSHPGVRSSLLMATGAVLLVLTRPYEGMLLCLPVATALLLWARESPVRGFALLRLGVPGLALVAGGIAWMGYYDLRAFGNPATLPYTINRATYALAPYYVWQKPRPEPAYHHAEMRRFYVVDELKDYERVHSVTGFPAMTVVKALRGILFFSGVVFLPVLVALLRALRDRRIRFLVICLVVLGAGMGIEIFLFPHYLAPFTAAFYAVGLQCMRHMRRFRPGGQAAGATLVRLTVLICIVMAGLRVFDRQLHCPVPGFPFSTWICNWFGPDHFVPERDRVEQALAQNPGGQLAIVRYAAGHDPVDEWVYNGADIDSAKVIWARAMDGAADAELLRYYPNRKAWLVQPDVPASEVEPYPVPPPVTVGSAR